MQVCSVDAQHLLKLLLHTCVRGTASTNLASSGVAQRSCKFGGGSWVGHRFTLVQKGCLAQHLGRVLVLQFGACPPRARSTFDELFHRDVQIGQMLLLNAWHDVRGATIASAVFDNVLAAVVCCGALGSPLVEEALLVLILLDLGMVLRGY